MDKLLSLYSSFELKAGAVAGAAWGFINFALGGVDEPILALAALMTTDFATGVWAAAKKGELSSAIGERGLLKKVGILACVIIANLLDMAAHAHTFRGMFIAAFAIIEAISILENVDRLGYGDFIPSFFQTKLRQIANERGINKHERGEGERK